MFHYEQKQPGKTNVDTDKKKKALIYNIYNYHFYNYHYYLTSWKVMLLANFNWQNFIAYLLLFECFYSITLKAE